MTTLEKFQEVAKINFVETHGDIEIGTIMTARRIRYTLYIK